MVALTVVGKLLARFKGVGSEGRDLGRRPARVAPAPPAHPVRHRRAGVDVDRFDAVRSPGWCRRSSSACSSAVAWPPWRRSRSGCGWWRCPRLVGILVGIAVVLFCCWLFGCERRALALRCRAGGPHLALLLARRRRQPDLDPRLLPRPPRRRLPGRHRRRPAAERGAQAQRSPARRRRRRGGPQPPGHLSGRAAGGEPVHRPLPPGQRHPQPAGHQRPQRPRPQERLPDVQQEVLRRHADRLLLRRRPSKRSSRRWTWPPRWRSRRRRRRPTWAAARWDRWWRS